MALHHRVRRELERPSFKSAGEGASPPSLHVLSHGPIQEGKRQPCAIAQADRRQDPRTAGSRFPGARGISRRHRLPVSPRQRVASLQHLRTQGLRTVE